MSRVLGLHLLELREGVEPRLFEDFVVREYLPAVVAALAPASGMAVELLRGERGARQGKYVLLFEFDDLASRDRYFPTAATISRELEGFILPLRELAGRWHSLVSAEKTDYVVLAGGRPCA